MCHDNQRCAGQVLALQDVSKAVELRRRLQERIEARRQLPSADEYDVYFDSGVIVGLQGVIVDIDELWPDYTHCDNPPAA